MSVFERIKETLNANGVGYDLREHPAVYTSQEAADARGCDLKQGAKALVLHVDKERYILAVISTVKKADFEKLRAHLGAKKVDHLGFLGSSRTMRGGRRPYLISSYGHFPDGTVPLVRAPAGDR